MKEDEKKRKEDEKRIKKIPSLYIYIYINYYH